ncbi:FG-GAP-like repeat-containing protein [Thermoactinospora rubra]|uniref:FG-GAP-like repeat-containing protein n=1 Tax=Thermoactinospora rubra TaxID=1088767 RepID=UPI000A104EDA|nr:FG-GAP-like repeat-containing protein [Thermoactinospora rubra]
MTRLLSALLLAAGTLAAVQPAASAADCPRAVAGDFDGDGAEDLAIGDPLAGPGAVHLLSGDKIVPLGAPALGEADGYGWAVRLADVNGDRCADLLVGAPYADVDGVIDAGAVYVLHGGAGAEPRRLVAPQPQQEAHFGWSIAAKGTLIAIGAPYEDEANAPDQGAVYVGDGVDRLRRYSQETTGIPGNGEQGDQFGWALAFGPGNKLVVGVPYENDDGGGRQIDQGKLDSGSMTVLEDVTAAQVTATKWEPQGLNQGDRFGYAVAYSDRAGLAVSAPRAGFVQLFDQQLKASRRIEETSAVSLAASSDGRLAIGLAGTGTVRVVGPDEDRTLEPAAPEARQGAAVAFAGNRLVVGAPDRGPYGAISVLGRNADRLEPLQPARGADFGSSLS